MDTTLTPGVFVTNPDHPEWGLGQIQSAIGAKVTVNFEHQGKVVLDLRFARLQPAAQAGEAG
jgi:Protein of unknown function (DUF3553)